MSVNWRAEIRFWRLTLLMSCLDEASELFQVSNVRRDLLKSHVHGVIGGSDVDWSQHQTFDLELRQAVHLLLHTCEGGTMSSSRNITARVWTINAAHQLQGSVLNIWRFPEEETATLSGCILNCVNVPLWSLPVIYSDFCNLDPFNSLDQVNNEQFIKIVPV